MRNHRAAAAWVAALPLLGLLGGCASARPAWTSAPPQGYAHDFFTGSGTGPGRAEARSAAVSSAVARFAESGRLNVQVVRTDSSLTTERFRTGSSPTLERIDRTVQEIITTGESPTIRGLRLQEEYTEQAGNRHEAWVLMAIPKTSGIREPPTRNSFVVRSMLLPGWGQYAMGNERKGLILALGAITAVPAAMTFSSLRAEDLNRARSTQIQESRIFYTNEANRYGTFTTVTIAGAVAIWGYGVIDAASSPVKLYVNGDRAGTRIGVSVAVGR